MLLLVVGGPRENRTPVWDWGKQGKTGTATVSSVQETVAVPVFLFSFCFLCILFLFLFPKFSNFLEVINTLGNFPNLFWVKFQKGIAQVQHPLFTTIFRD